MAPEPRPRRGLATLCAAFLGALLLAAPAHALRFVDYNLLNYPGSSGAARDPRFQRILTPLGADVIGTEEQVSSAGANEFLNSVLNVIEPGQWALAPFGDYSTDTESALYYKPARVQFLGHWAFFPNPANNLRTVNVYRLKPVGYSSGNAEFRIYLLHLKASTGSANVAQRAAEAHGLRDTLNALPAGVTAIVAGDFNFYTGTEAGLDTLTASKVNNRGRLWDPLNLAGVNPWQDNTSMQYAWTQSPCLSGGATCASGASTGGMDDRFDLVLGSYDAKDGEGIELLPNTYAAVGNDGLHHNNNITDLPTIPEGAAYASDLILSSDHLPLRVDLSLPARISAPAGPLAFGVVLQGATAPTQNVTIANPATAPADTLEYVYSAAAGFVAPAGTQTRLVGASADDVISLDTSTLGPKAGNLNIVSNDLDTPNLAIAMTGEVRRHAAASLDSVLAVTADTLDFGDHLAGGFSNGLVRVHDYLFNAVFGFQQAQLLLTSAGITGPAAARFSIVGGFTPVLVAGTAQSYAVAFDDTGAPADSVYEADLAVATADEPLPGATAQGTLAVHLRAKVMAGNVGTPIAQLPAETRLYRPFPNPLVGSCTIRFDLAQPVHASLEVFDLAGRRVATLARGAFEPGSYTARWDGRLESGQSAGAGIYFVRMSGTGIPTENARIAVVR